MNEVEREPSISLGLAKVYLNATDPKLATRTWQEVMEHIVGKKTGETRHRWETAIKDKNFDCIRNLPVAETRPEHFDKALADGKVSTNVYLRRMCRLLEWELLDLNGHEYSDNASFTRQSGLCRNDCVNLQWHAGTKSFCKRAGWWQHL